MLVMAAFKAPMIAQIMGSVAVVMTPVKRSALLAIDSMFSIVTTVAPVSVIITVKMAVSGNTIAVLAFQLVLPASLCTVFFYVLLLMSVAFVLMLSIKVTGFLVVVSIGLLAVIAVISRCSIIFTFGKCRSGKRQQRCTKGQYRQ